MAYHNKKNLRHTKLSNLDIKYVFYIYESYNQYKF